MTGKLDQPPRIKLQARGLRLAYSNERTHRRLEILAGIDLIVREG